VLVELAELQCIIHQEILETLHQLVLFGCLEEVEVGMLLHQDYMVLQEVEEVTAVWLAVLVFQVWVIVALLELGLLHMEEEVGLVLLEALV
jgi:hypothetical protein